MLIKNLFKKNIFRPINGVVKAEELDESSVWQELDEFVITKELDKHLRKFLAAFLDVIDNKKNPAVTGKMGVWISGWFGCGKSHFLKVLSYLLKNAVHSFQGQSRSAVEFFEDKIEDAMMLGDVKRAVASNTDVILFNIDSKADPRAGREAILGVFLKVLNELQGYDGDHPHIAHMERHLDSKDKLAEFHAAYKALAGNDWVPFPISAVRNRQVEIIPVVEEALALSRSDWDVSETSWGFSMSPLLAVDCRSSSVDESYASFSHKCLIARTTLRRLEEKNNSLFVETYGLEQEVACEVLDEQITLYQPERDEDVKRLISYAIGCVLGRYSLDGPGLMYAHSGNQGFDPTKYKVFHADLDGIIPITDTEWFSDDAANRVVEFIATAWPREHLEENLKCLAESLGPNKGESSRDTIRRYLSQGFYKHHLSMYKKRPIYWLFSSGKQGAFECLVYLHRYNEGTLSRMRTEYVIPLQGKIDARIEQLREDIASATSSAHGKRLQKERDKLVKQQAELRKFDEKLRHYADLRISLDLDHGVKVNYGKFGDLLAEVKTVAGAKVED